MRDLIYISYSPGWLSFKRLMAWCYWVLAQRLIHNTKGQYRMIVNRKGSLNVAFYKTEQTLAGERGYEYIVPKRVADEMKERFNRGLECEI